jgi:hypothetical protein
VFGSHLEAKWVDARGVRVPTKGALSKRPLLVGISSSQQNVEQSFSTFVWGIKCRRTIWMHLI